MKAIQSATLVAAQLLRIENKLGTLKERKLYDVVAVKGNPLDDVKAMYDIVFVMKESVTYKSP